MKTPKKRIWMKRPAMMIFSPVLTEELVFALAMMAAPA